MQPLDEPLKSTHKVKRKYNKTGLHSKQYKAFVGKKTVPPKVLISAVKVLNEIDTSHPKYHDLEVRGSFKRCNVCGSVLKLTVTGCQFCVRYDRTHEHMEKDPNDTSQ